jgi:hypothetical protein
MLYKDSFIISPLTFKLIQELQLLPELVSFPLVGGTSLALQLGHRNSNVIDLFTQNDFDEDDLLKKLNSKYELKEIFRRKHTIISLIDNIKTDFIKHDYPYVLPPITEEGITFLSKEDISAMKLHAIVQSGKRLKDFIDIYFLLEHFSINQMMDFFVHKYAYSNPIIALKALGYFGDIDENIDPPKLLKPLPISKIEARIIEAIKKPSKVF